MLGGPGGSQDPDTRDDLLLMVALQIHEDGLCSCGHHRDDAWDPRATGNYEVSKRECQACAKAEKDAQENKDRTEGEKRFVYDATAYPD